ncbi:MAG: prolyl oligopeptidase family serine peptidase [Thermomicrobiales bacterium]
MVTGSGTGGSKGAELLDRAVYERAAALRPQRRDALIDRQVLPRAIAWLTDGGFIYRTTENGEPRHVLVDPHTRSHTEITSEDAGALPVWTPPAPRRPVSPAGTFELVPRDNDLWLRDLTTGDEARLTTDGSDEQPYGTDAQNGTGNTGNADIRPTIVNWSPDGRFALTQRTDVRGARRVPLLESSPADGSFPRTETYIDAYPGDEHVRLAEVYIVDTASRSIRKAAIPPLVSTHSSPLVRHDLWWDASSRTVFCLHSSRDWLALVLYAIDPETGAATELVREEDERRVRPSQQFHQKPNVAVLTDEAGTAQEIVWYSLRDGWGHLYRYDARTGGLIQQLTTGECGVEEILRVDPASRRLWIAVSGLVTEDPYRQTICTVDLDGGNLVPLTGDGLDHRALVPPSPEASALGYLDWASTVDTPPTVTFRDWSGDILVALETANLARLEATGWQRPQRFHATAADGETQVWGTFFLPPDFDPTKIYPVVDHLYPGPQRHHCLPFFFPNDAEPLAALGTVAVTMDGRGTPGRSRAFHDYSWRNVGCAGGIEDHVSALRELAQTRPWLDLTRVGTVGHSAGGFAVVRAMEIAPDFYRVGVAQSGRHDGRMVMAMIMEAYDGPPDAESYARASAVESAGDITGKLLLIQGEMDRGVPMAHSLRVAERMILANRDVEMLILPGDDHMYTRFLPYVERRTWDYLVWHLLHVEPPHEFRIA